MAHELLSIVKHCKKYCKILKKSFVDWRHKELKNSASSTCKLEPLHALNYAHALRNHSLFALFSLRLLRSNARVPFHLSTHVSFVSVPSNSSNDLHDDCAVTVRKQKTSDRDFETGTSEAPLKNSEAPFKHSSSLELTRRSLTPSKKTQSQATYYCKLGIESD